MAKAAKSCMMDGCVCRPKPVIELARLHGMMCGMKRRLEGARMRRIWSVAAEVTAGGDVVFVAT